MDTAALRSGDSVSFKSLKEIVTNNRTEDLSVPNWACSLCGMISGRRESVIRHINNPRIHAGQALAVPYIEFISRSKNGTPISSSAYVYRSRMKTMYGSPLVKETFYDKLVKRIEDINLEKFAERFTNSGSTWLHQEQLPPTFPLGPRRSMLKQVTHYLGENIFAIRGHLCPKCITIEPEIYGFGSAVNANFLSILYPIHPECTDIPAMSYSERRESLNLFATKGFPEIVREWIRSIWSSNLRMRMIALKVPGSKHNPDKNDDVSSTEVALNWLGYSSGQLRWSTGSSVTVVSDTISNGENDRLMALNRKEITLHYVNSDFIYLPNGIGSQSSPQIPNLVNSFGVDNTNRTGIIEKAIESSDIIINSESELLEFLSVAKFGTFGFFRIGPTSAMSKSPPTEDSEDGYLLLLTPEEFGINRKFSITQTSSPSHKSNP
jgi:hypothetical protein